MEGHEQVEVAIHLQSIFTSPGGRSFQDASVYNFQSAVRLSFLAASDFACTLVSCQLGSLSG